MFARMRMLWRTFRFLSKTAWVVARVAWYQRFCGVNARTKIRQLRKNWARSVFPCLGIEVTTEGEVPDFQCIIVANHRSYLDPLLLLRDVDALPVSKSELANYPLVGKGAQWSGVILLDRQSQNGGVAALRDMTAALRAGESIIIFPEGTTSCGDKTLPFLKGAFQVAAKNNIPVVPSALIFEHSDDFWVGEESLANHAMRRFRIKKNRMKVCYGSALHSRDAEILLTAAQRWIDEKINNVKENWAG